MDELISLPPFLPLLLGGLFAAILPLYGQRAIYLLAPIAAMMAVSALDFDSVFPVTIAGTTVHFLAVQENSKLFGLAFCVAISASLLLGLKHAKKQEMAAALVAASGGLGIVFAGDLISLILFWEILMLACAYLIFVGGMKQSRAAAKRYLIMHILGGSFLLAGIAGTITDSGIAAFPSFQLLFSMPESVAEWSAWLMLMGVMVNLAALPFSAWLPDSYSAASPFGMVPLSAFTTKSALFVLMQVFVGSTPLIVLGLGMLFYGAMMALTTSHIRRHLCYALIAQMGVMVMAVGIGSSAAMAGVAVLAFCHIGYNGLLMTAAANIIRTTGKYHLSDLGGLWRQMPVTSGAILLGALCMAALPFTGTYIGKFYIAESLAATDHPFLYFLFVAGTSIAIYALFPWYALSGKSKFPNAKEVKIEIHIAYILFAALAVGNVSIAEYSWVSVGKQLLLIAGSLGAFFLLLPMLKRRKVMLRDIDYIYRTALPYVFALINQFCGVLAKEWLKFIKRLKAMAHQFVSRAFGIYANHTLYGIATTTALIIILCAVLLSVTSNVGDAIRVYAQ